MEPRGKGHYGPCSKCRSRMKINGVCKICGDGKKQPKEKKLSDIVDKVKKAKTETKDKPEAPKE